MTRAAVRKIPGLDVLDERLAGAPGVFDYDPLRLAIDVRGTRASGYELARLLREQHDVIMELAGENVMVAVYGMGEDAGAASERLLAALRETVETVSATTQAVDAVQFAPPPPWGELVMTPRDAFLGPQEVVRGFRVARGVPAGDSERAAGRAPHRRDARLHRADDRARRQPARGERPRAEDAARGARVLDQPGRQPAERGDRRLEMLLRRVLLGRVADAALTLSGTPDPAAPSGSTPTAGGDRR